MKLRSCAAALLLGLAIAACQPAPGGEGESEPPASEPASSDAAAPDASATPYSVPGY